MSSISPSQKKTKLQPILTHWTFPLFPLFFFQDFPSIKELRNMLPASSGSSACSFRRSSSSSVAATAHPAACGARRGASGTTGASRSPGAVQRPPKEEVSWGKHEKTAKKLVKNEAKIGWGSKETKHLGSFFRQVGSLMGSWPRTNAFNLCDFAPQHGHFFA